MKRYEKYKPSGVEWIGEIPEHWSLATVGRVSTIGRGRVISHVEIGENAGEYPVYSSQTENNGVMGYLNTFDFDGEYVTWTTDGANAGTVFHRKGKFNCTNVCGTIQPKNGEQIDLRYLPYFLNLGTRYSVRLDINPKLMNNMMAKIPFVIPPKKEQATIANFLDEKTTQIDALIANKQKLIELLKEERTAIINHAVTKGINPKAKLKPSSIEWLGDIPEHWEVKKLSYGFNKIGSGTTPASGNAEYYNNGIINWLQTGDLNDGEINSTSKKITVQALKDYTTLREYPIGSLVIAMYGATIGKVGILNIATTTNQACCVIAEPISFDTTYVFYWFICNKEYVVSKSYGGGQPNISQELIKSLRLPCPPKTEQTQIVQHIETSTQAIDATISKIEKEIELLQEYRTAIISEVVTGKIKVI